MGDRHGGLLGQRWRTVTGICTLALGFQAMGLASGPALFPTGQPASAEHQPLVSPPLLLAPRQSLLWTIESADSTPHGTMSGTSEIGPDGKIFLGPYGSAHVAGLSLEQARRAVVQHLAGILKHPRVVLQLAEEAGPHLGEPAALATIGRVVPAGGEEPADNGAPALIAESTAAEGLPAGQAVPQGNGQPLPTVGEPPLVTHTDAGVPAAGGTWIPRPEGETAAARESASQWKPITSGSTIPHPRVLAAGWQPQPPVQGNPSPQALTVNGQPEPPATDLKVFPQKMPAGPAPKGTEKPEPGIVQPEPAAEALPMPVPPPPLPPVPTEQTRVSLPPYVVDPPDILIVESNQGLRDQPIRGQHLVRPDGTIGLGIYGSVHVAGMTLEQAKDAIAQQLGIRIAKFDARNLSVDVLAYNSKFYYVITDGGGFGEAVIRLPVTGNETVLDAISQISGLPAVASKKHIWVARATPGHDGQQEMPVDWIGITQHGCTSTNYQVMPNDRIYVKAQKLVTFDTWLGRFLSPVERVLGITLLGSSTVNSIHNRGTNNNGG